MLLAFKVWHSEAHKSPSKALAGRPLSAAETCREHENLAVFLEHHHDADPSFHVHMTVLRPSIKGVIIVLESGADNSDAADAWIASFLVRLNKLEPNLCLVAEPLPAG